MAISSYARMERRDKGLIMNTQEWKIKIHTFIRQTDNVKVEQ